MIRRNVALVFALAPLVILTAAADEANRFAAIDRHALAAAQADEASIASLAAYLIQPAKTDTDKARALFRWLTDRIAYDASLLKDTDANRPEHVLKNRKAVCMGYADLFTELASAAGLEALSIRGVAKSRAAAETNNPAEPGSHRWNAVRIDGVWQLLDATWGAGSSKNGAFVKSLNDYYFLTPPESLIFSHFPQVAQWQLLAPAIAEEDYLKQARTVNHHIFYYGVSSAEVRRQIGEPTFREFVKVLDLPAETGSFAIREAPLDRYQKPGAKCRFVFESESKEFPLVAVIQQNQRIALTRKGNTFEGTITLRPDPHLRVVRYNRKGNAWTYHTVLEYVVE
jgi:hypothetical protein